MGHIASIALICIVLASPYTFQEMSQRNQQAAYVPCLINVVQRLHMALLIAYFRMKYKACYFESSKHRQV